jgi:predicted metal-dependent HD superfamily phosphohydrolase
MELGIARQQWLADTGHAPGAEQAFDELLGRYRAQERSYHDEHHVLAVAADVGELLHHVVAPDAAAVRLAAWFHDAVYDPRSTTNEHDSAELACRVLSRLGVGPARIDEVRRLILLTARHEPVDPATDPAGAIVLDADLAVLGAEPARYDAYAHAVRAEYGHVDDRAWRSGRAAVLRRFLGAATIFATPTMRTREARARANLAAELAALEDGRPNV